MKYGVVMCLSTDNIGDDIQSYAARRFLPSVDYVIDRESLDTFGLTDPDRKEPVSAILNGWFMYQKFNWPPSERINPLFLSMHISEDDYFGVGDRFLDSLGGEYFKPYGPIGARDDATLELLRKKGIDAYLSGCLTLTLKLPGSVEKSDEVILADVGEKAAGTLMERYPGEHWVRLTHCVDPEVSLHSSAEERFAAVEALLRRYRNAKCVVTERLHCALPCLALETPVLLLYRPEYLNRMNSFFPLLHTAPVGDAEKGVMTFDVASPPSNPDLYREIRRDLEHRCEAFVQDAESGRYPRPAPIPPERLRVWQKGLLNNAEVRFRETIEDLQGWIRSVEKARDWNEKQLDLTKSRVKELEDWTAELEKAKAYGEDQLTAKDARITELEGWTAELEKAKAYSEEQLSSKDARIQELEGWTEELEKGKAYTEEQLTAKEARITELEGWTAELEKAKAYIEDQLAAKDARIQELEGWTAELEMAKRYLEGQVTSKNARIDELESWTAELEKGKEYLEGQVAARTALITELESGIIETGKRRDKHKEPSLSSGANKVLPQNKQADQKEFISIPAENEKKKHGNGFDHIISLGYNCEVSFRIGEYLGGKPESFPLSWVYIKDQSNTVFILDHLSTITEAQRFPFVSKSGMFLVEELNIAVHSHVRPQHPGAPESAFLDEASKEIRSRFAHLNEKWKDVLAGNDSVLFLLKLQDWRGQEKCAELIKELNAWLSSEFKSGKYLLVCFTAQRENYEHICQDKVIQSLSKVRVNYIRFFAPDENTKDGGDRVSWLEAIDRWYHCSDSCD